MRFTWILFKLNCLKYLNHSLNPFIQTKEQGTINEICAVSLPFLEYFEINKANDGTTQALIELYENKKILTSKFFFFLFFLNKNQ